MRSKERIPRQRRRRLLKLLPLVVLHPAAFAHGANSSSRLTPDASLFTPYAPVTPGHRLRFPEDEGSHPAFRTEWWYVTGWLQPEQRPPVGFQITFFRTRPETDESNPSAFTPRQLVIAHAALSDAARGRLVHDQKLARASFGLAGADEGRTHVWIDDWSLAQDRGSYRVRIPSREFEMDVTFTPTQPPLLQGDDGYSRKGPEPRSASYYYSIPQLRVRGTLLDQKRRAPVTGTAWLDHEWSSSYMDARAAGWDWIGINFDDGAALMAFRMRERNGGKLWAGGSYRDKSGARRVFSPAEVELVPLRSWRSPRTGATYPVVWRVELPGMALSIEPLMDDQEHDTRGSVGTIYWEGAVTAMRDGKPIGRGYLELTGYWKPMKL